MSVERAREVIDLLSLYDNQYFTGQSTTLSDEDYDLLWFELKCYLENPEISKALKRDKMPLGSYEMSSRKRSHTHRVVSLDKVKSDDKITFEKQSKRYFTKLNLPNQYTLQPKYDGMTIVLYKKVNQEPLFITRGDGSHGEDVTDRFREIPEIWEAACSIDKDIIIRGEAIVADLENRSIVSGAVRSTQKNAAADINVEVIWYEILSHPENELDTLSKLELLQSYGLSTAQLLSGDDYVTLDDVINLAFEKANDYEFSRNGRYPLDGLVIKPAHTGEFISQSQNHSSNQLAVKFPPLSSLSILTGVEFNQGKDGRMTPIAIFEPVKIGDRQFSRASLGSWKLLQDMDLRVGDEIIVKIMNDVIPKIFTGVASPKAHENREIIQMPENCFVEGAHLYSNREVTIQGVLESARVVLDLALPNGVISTLLANGVVSLSQLLETRGCGFGLTPAKEQPLEQSIERALRRFDGRRVIGCYEIRGLGKKVYDSFENTNHDSFESAVEFHCPEFRSSQWFNDAASACAQFQSHRG